MFPWAVPGAGAGKRTRSLPFRCPWAPTEEARAFCLLSPTLWNLLASPPGLPTRCDPTHPPSVFSSQRQGVVSASWLRHTHFQNSPGKTW